MLWSIAYGINISAFAILLMIAKKMGETDTTDAFIYTLFFFGLIQFGIGLVVLDLKRK